MKVCAINTVAYGSTGKIMLQIAEQGKKSGFEVYTYSMKWKNQSEMCDSHEYFGTFIENAISIRLGKYLGLNGCFAYFGTKKLISQIDVIKPDIIHLHNLHNCFINLPLLFRYIKKNNISVVWTLHDCWSFTGQCAHFTMAKCEKWKEINGGCNHCIQHRYSYPVTIPDTSKLMWKLKKKWFCGVDNLTIVTPSKWLAELTKNSFLKKYPIMTINNGIDLSIFKPIKNDCIRQDLLRENNSTSKYIVLGVALGWSTEKGLDTFIELSKRLPKEYKIVLVGTDSEVEKLIPSNIISINKTADQGELAQIYAAADIFVNPTLEDVFPSVNMEALACGTPIITYNTGGSPECVDDTCGIVIECGDIDGLENSIINVCKNKYFTADSCISKAKEFNKSDKFQEYIKLYERLL